MPPLRLPKTEVTAVRMRPMGLPKTRNTSIVIMAISAISTPLAK